MTNYNKLYTAQDSAIVFIDHQPQMLFGVANADRAGLINNVTLLAKCAKEFGVPAVLTAVETESFSGYVWPQLLDVFPGQPVVERSSIGSFSRLRCVLSVRMRIDKWKVTESKAKAIPQTLLNRLNDRMRLAAIRTFVIPVCPGKILGDARHAF